MTSPTNSRRNRMHHRRVIDPTTLASTRDTEPQGWTTSPRPRVDLWARTLFDVFVRASLAYTDTVEFNSEVHLTAAQERTLRETLGGRRAIPSKVCTPTGEFLEANYTAHQPTQATFRFIDSLGSFARLVRVDEALDLIVYRPEDAPRLHDLVRRSIAVMCGFRTHEVDFHGTTYMPEVHVRRGLQVVIYSDRPSKAGGYPCVHIEFRFWGKKVLEKHFLLDPLDVLAIDHRKFWARHFDLRVAPSDEVLQARWKRASAKLRRDRTALGLPVRPLGLFRDEDAAIEVAKMLDGLQEIRPGPSGRPCARDLYLHLLESTPWRGVVTPKDFPRLDTDALLPRARSALWDGAMTRSAWMRSVDLLDLVADDEGQLLLV